MFGRKKSDNFEWHKYVRTTIKLRREDRRRRLEDMKGVAVDGLKEAGRAGVEASVSWLDRLGRWVVMPLTWFGYGMWAAGRSGAWTGRALYRGAVAVGRGMRRPVSGLAEMASHPITKRIVLAIAGICALLAVGRATAGAWGVTTQSLIAAALALPLLLVLPPLLAKYAPPAFGWLRPRVAAAVAKVPVPTLPRVVVQRGLAGLLLAVGAAGIVWVGYRTATDTPTLAMISLPVPIQSPSIEGRPTSASGDSLTIGGTHIRLSGVQAPEESQTCGGQGRERPWRCGLAARTALREMVRGKTIKCDLDAAPARGQTVTGTCHLGEKDIAAELVERGHVFADAGLFSSYGRLEQDARNAKLGLWRGGRAERPNQYRARLWEVAKRKAPDGCPIKGYVSRGKRLYVTPWDGGYSRRRVSTRRGGRWFCNEKEALAAGWQPAERS